MKHNPQTEEQIAAAGLMQPGVYDFTIVSAEEKQSQSGNDMFALKLNVFDHDGTARVILDWVLPSFAKKYKHLHDACGLLDLYQSGETKPSDLAGKSGKASIAIGGPYTDKNGIERVNNRIDDYIKRENSGTIAMPREVEDDEIPFG